MAPREAISEASPTCHAWHGAPPGGSSDTCQARLERLERALGLLSVNWSSKQVLPTACGQSNLQMRCEQGLIADDDEFEEVLIIRGQVRVGASSLHRASKPETESAFFWPLKAMRRRVVARTAGEPHIQRQQKQLVEPWFVPMPMEHRVTLLALVPTTGQMPSISDTLGAKRSQKTTESEVILHPGSRWGDVLAASLVPGSQRRQSQEPFQWLTVSRACDSRLKALRGSFGEFKALPTRPEPATGVNAPVQGSGQVFLQLALIMSFELPHNSHWEPPRDLIGSACPRAKARVGPPGR